MTDLNHYATLADLFGAGVFRVGSGAHDVYSTVQAAATAAEAAVVAGTYARALVLIAPGTYLEDVLVRTDKVDLIGQGPQGSVIVRSYTISDATAASIAIFNGNGLKASLAIDAALTNPPTDNIAQNVKFIRDAGAAAWVGDARASVRLLGAPVAGGTFLSTGAVFENCEIGKANGSAAGKGSLFACYTNMAKLRDVQAEDGGILFDQCAQAFFYDTTEGIQTTWTYDSTATVPAGAADGLVLVGSDVITELELNGDVADATGYNSFLGSIDDNATGASACLFKGCHCEGAIDIAALGPTIAWNGGDICVAPSGAGAAGFVQLSPVLVGDMIPASDNTTNLGSTTNAYASVHARSFDSHSDVTNTVGVSMIGSAIDSKGAHFNVRAGIGAFDTVGWNLLLRGGTGGTGSAVGGGTGGGGSLHGGQGGMGTAALAAGQGGQVVIGGGAGGTDLGGGGGNGGGVVIDGGLATGAAVNGAVSLGTAVAPLIEVGCDVVSDTDNTDKLGTTAKAFSQVHGRSVVAHDDATDTIKTTITGSLITPTVAHSIKPTVSAADTAGKNETIGGGNGGVATAGVGGVGGNAIANGGTGGAGTAALAAGAGGQVALQAGDAGANNGGGGANGGDVTMAGGAATGGGRPGYVSTTSGFKLHAIALAGRAALGLAAPADAGVMIFCTDAGPAGVGIPLWFDDDGNWRDAAGNVVA